MNIHRKLYAFIFATFTFLTFASTSDVKKPAFEIEVGAQQVKKIPLVLVLIGKHDVLDELSAYIKDDLLFTDQFLVDVTTMPEIPHKKQIKELEKSGYTIALFLTYNPKKKACDLRLYNVHKGSMITNKGYLVTRKSKEIRGWAHALSDLILEKLTGQPGFFCSKLTYCKELCPGKRQLCISDYDGSHEQALLQTSFLMAPRWNLDEDTPAIYYSRRTPTNLRLMQYDMQTGKEKVVASYAGLNMLPAFSPSTDEMIVCLSCKGGTNLFSAVYDKYKKRFFYKQLTFNDGNNISPTVLENGDIIFCSDFEAGRPQLYRLNRVKDELQCLSEPDDFCFDPVYCPVNKKLIYTKMTDGVGQLWLYDSATGKKRQLTHDAAHKQETSWSPCGNYIAYCWTSHGKKKIVIQNITTGIKRTITPENVDCSYPSWSMNFDVFPVFLH